MKWMGKVTGGLLGALALGPIGAALGVLLGHQFDEDSAAAPAALPEEDLRAIGERFFRATFHVMGYLAKADGRVSEPEIAAARAVMAELRLDAEQIRQAIACFTAGKQPGFDLAGELSALAHACRGRPDLVRVFLEIQVRAALAGNNLEGAVRPHDAARGQRARHLGLRVRPRRGGAAHPARRLPRRGRCGATGRRRPRCLARAGLPRARDHERGER